jgi:putative hemolysin
MDDVAAPPVQSKHIVDILIEERAPHLSNSPFWPVLRPMLYAVLNYDKARYMGDRIAPMRGHDALEFIAQLLSVRLDVSGLHRLPASGPFFILANHPTGITDGIAMYDAIKHARPDVKFYANSDAHRACPGFIDNLIPVEWVPGKRTRERTRVTLKMTEAAMAVGEPIMIFPAGRLARRRNGLLVDPEWMPTAISLARKYEVPIVPCHVAGPYAFWFHSFAAISSELRDITLFHELLNKRGKTYRLNFGRAIPPDQLAGDAAVVTRRIKHYIERVLGNAPDAVFDPEGPECAWRDPPALVKAAEPRPSAPPSPS